jgi:hypothetical protein
VALVERQFLNDAKATHRLESGKRGHIGNFLECVKSRKRSIASEIAGGHTAICCHLLNQSYFHGNAKIRWNPKTYTFCDGTGDPSWLTGFYREPFII